jgi:hypothetical protein
MEQRKDEATTPILEEEVELGELIPIEWLRKPLWIRVLLGSVGVLCIALGFVGWLMPVIPGFMLIPLGVVLLAATSRWCARRLNRLERRLSERTRRFIRHPVHWMEARLPGDWKRKTRRRKTKKLAERSQP